MRSEQRKVDRQIRGVHARERPFIRQKCLTSVNAHPPCCIAGIQREEEKVKKSVKDAAKRGDTGTAKMLAKEIVRSRKATTRLHTSKAQMNSVVMQMENQMGEQHTTPMACRCSN